MPSNERTEPATIENVRPGDILIADGGFTCIQPGARLTVQRCDRLLELYVPCADGKHFIDGQLDEDGRFVGFQKDLRAHRASA